ncbi:MAG: DUF4339 domain-containing protein [Polyangiaceae bacterium]
MEESIERAAGARACRGPSADSQPSTSRAATSKRASRSEMLTVPGVHPPPQGLDSLLGDEEEERGPEWCVDLGDEIRAMNKFELWLALGTGDFAPTTLVWRIGRERWQPARDIPELACALKVHAQTLMMAARAAEQAAESRGGGDAPERSSRESLPRVLTPENSVLVARLSDAETPEQPDTEVAPALSDRAPANVTPITRARPSRGRPVARFATALAAVAGTLFFLMSRGDAARMTASIADAAPREPLVEVSPEPAREPEVIVESAPTPPAGQVALPGASGAARDMDPAEDKPKKKTSTRKRAKDGGAGSVAGVEADRRGRARQRRTR